MGEWIETDFGRIPSQWDLKRICDLKSPDKRAIAMGPFGSNIKAENFTNAGVPVIRGTNLNFARYVGGEFVYLTEQKADELIGSNCKAGDIVFTHRGTIGQVGLIPENKYKRYVISQSGMKLTVNPELIDNKFLFYFFKSEFGQFQLLKYEAQVGVPSISNPLSSLKEIEVPIPPLDEQTAISSILSSLDDKIDLLQCQNATLEKMAETLFRQWFVEEAKEDWKDDRLSFFANFYNGKSRPREQGKIPIYGGNGILGYTSKSNYSGKSIIIGRVGAYCGSLYYENGEIWVSDNALLVKPKMENTTYFLFHLLKTLNLNSMAEGSSHPLLTQTLLKSIEIQLPPIQKINDFDHIGEDIQRKISFNQTQILTLTAFRDTLLPKLMSGEVRAIGDE